MGQRKGPEEKSFLGLQKHPGVGCLETHPVPWSSLFHRPLEDHKDLETEEDPGAQGH